MTEQFVHKINVINLVMYKQDNVVTTFCKCYALIELSILISTARKVCNFSTYRFLHETYLSKARVALEIFIAICIQIIYPERRLLLQ